MNYRIDADAIQALLPGRMRAKRIEGHAIGGICLIRLAAMRPAWWPLPLGIGGESAAHRIAVEWDTDEGTKEGVYIPRRDTSSRWLAGAGGRAFPGQQRLAQITADEDAGRYRVAVESGDGEVHVSVDASESTRFPEDSVFPDLATASTFFEAGGLGYSERSDCAALDGIELCCDRWEMQPLDVHAVHSSYFEANPLLPKSAVAFDCALLMTDIPHAWVRTSRLDRS